MREPCERCKKSRLQLSILFTSLILINLVIRLVLGLEIKSLPDILLLPSLGLIFSALSLYLLRHTKD